MHPQQQNIDSAFAYNSNQAAQIYHVGATHQYRHQEQRCISGAINILKIYAMNGCTDDFFPLCEDYSTQRLMHEL